ncbi:hypothetical protein GCM10010121_038300 [Streptomyces brasiliensis]|uniref:Uncharacterized protein n=1 Tax=Streptomyces brasiliensis TaxID=1954 RepID=A0A917NSB8_9ACTN|nr:hypothetical protein GCM10010121_038300 [Streptomyces brasiliensis]
MRPGQRLGQADAHRSRVGLGVVAQDDGHGAGVRHSVLVRDYVSACVLFDYGHRPAPNAALRKRSMFIRFSFNVTYFPYYAHRTVTSRIRETTDSLLQKVRNKPLKSNGART